MSQPSETKHRLIEHFGLASHSEGGFYRDGRTHRDSARGVNRRIDRAGGANE